MPNDRRAIAGVFLSKRRVGTLGYLNGNTWFDYEDRDPVHPVLGQAFEGDPDRRRTASGTVPEWFANLLPEIGSGLREMVSRELGRANPHDFQILAHLGMDLPGAVCVVPESDLHDVEELIPRTPRNLDHPIRYSLAGVQPKFSMRWRGKGLVLPMSGEGGDWIVKLPDRRFPEVPANEFAMLTWAQLAGIDIPEIKLLRGEQLSGLPAGLIEPDELAFGVKRFDRISDGRAHQEDLAQVREISAQRKYDNATYSGIGRIFRAVCLEDFPEYVRRLTAIVVMGNTDAHLKNWSIRYPDGRTGRLSPAYDFVSVSAYEDFRHDTLAFAINGGHVAGAISLANFIRFAERTGADPELVVTTVRTTVNALTETWPQVKQECPVPDFVAKHIDTRLRSLPLVTDRS